MVTYCFAEEAAVVLGGGYVYLPVAISISTVIIICSSAATVITVISIFATINIITIAFQNDSFLKC